MRLILVSFAALALVFYELSGGADFEPRGTRDAARFADQTESIRTATAEAPATPVLAPRKIREPATTPVLTEPPQVTVSDTPAATPDATAQDTAPQATNLPRLAQGTTASNLQLASLSDGLAGFQTAPAAQQQLAPQPAPEPAPDLREITGTRVNMRQGPGTNFGIIARLSLGHEVEVLSESGTGWLRLRTHPQGTVGWISASLVSK